MSVTSCQSNASGAAKSVSSTGTTKAVSNFDRAKAYLCTLPGVTEKDVEKALHAVGPPYGTQEAMLKIQQAREEKKWKRPARCTFEPHLGMEVRKLFQGSKTPFCGRVIVGEPVDKEEEDGQVYKNWCVEYTDGDREDMTEHELRRCYQWRARTHLSCTGRPFQCLELFCGEYCAYFSDQLLITNAGLDSQL